MAVSKLEPRLVRVALITQTMAIGGVERCITRVVNGLHGSDFEFAVICLGRSGPAAEWITVKGVSVVEIGKREGNDWRATLSLAKVLRTGAFDIVHSHHWGTLLETTVARSIARVPIHVHSERGTVLGPKTGPPWRHRLRGLAMGLALRRVDAVLSNAHAVARRVEEASGFPAGRIQIIPNGYDLILSHDELVDARQQQRRALGLPHDAFLLGSVGRLVAVKALGDAVRALAKAVGRGHHELHLLLVGDGPEGASLKCLANQLNVSTRVHFVGHQGDPTRWLAAMDVFLNCSLSEGMSQAVVEALSVSLPCIVSGVGDSPLMIGGDNPCGIVVAPGDSTELADAFVALAGSPARRTELAERARDRYISRYTGAAMLASFRRFYATVSPRAARRS